MIRCDWCRTVVHQDEIVEAHLNFYSTNEKEIQWSDYDRIAWLCKVCAKNAILVNGRTS